MATSLSSAVSSLQSSINLLDSSVSILDQGVSDFPRLCKVLQTTRHFELLPEPTLQSAQAALLSEITPSIAHLLNLAQSAVDKLSRREESLRAKSQLQEGRLGHSRKTSFDGDEDTKSVKRGGVDKEKELEFKRLRQRKERLKYTVERLELQGRQRERELRKSMAFQGE